MKNDSYRSQFRLPYDLYEKLQAGAERNRRSLNSELVARLESSFNEQAPHTDPRDAAQRRAEMADMARAVLKEMGIEPQNQ